MMLDRAKYKQASLRNEAESQAMLLEHHREATAVTDTGTAASGRGLSSVKMKAFQLT